MMQKTSSGPCASLLPDASARPPGARSLLIAVCLSITACTGALAGGEGAESDDLRRRPRRDGGHNGGSSDAGAVVDAASPPRDGGSTVDAGGRSSDAGMPSHGGGAVGPTRTSFVPSGPIVLRSGDTITGLHITSTIGPCISGGAVTDVRITDNRIGPCGPTASGLGVELGRSDRVRVDHNAFDDVASALYVIGAGGGSDIVFDHNRATRIRGPFPRGQMVQLNDVHGAGHRVVCNVSDQTTPGYLDGPEDHVNIFLSSGTSTSPIEIAYNRVRGGGPSRSGGGLLGGDNVSAYVYVHDNVLINPGQYGVAIAGGHDIRLVDNRVYSPTVFPWSNIGLVVWNQTAGASCYGHEVRGNRIYYVNASGVPNPAWNAGNCGQVAGWDANTWDDRTLTAAMWDETFAACE